MLNKKLVVALLAVVVLFLGVFSFAQGNNNEPKEDKTPIVDETDDEGDDDQPVNGDETGDDQPVNGDETGDEDGEELLIPVRQMAVKDTTAPLITLIGDGEIVLDLGETYTEAGATALDNVDGNITSTITTVSTLNSNVAGRYTITYDISDAAGNAATQVVRKVTVKPIIEVNQEIINVELGFNPTPAPVAILVTSKNMPGEILKETADSDLFDKSKLGTYVYKYAYSMTTSDGQTITADPKQITLVVTDNVKPEVVSISQLYQSKQDGRIKTTMVFSEPIKSMGSDWAKINDTTYVYYYYRTKDVTLSFEDLAGNKNTKVFSVDRTSPVGTINYSTTELTNGNVIATLETTESIKEIDGWTKESNTVFKKEYAANTDETVNFEDLIGNPGNALISITNIDKVKPEVVSISQLYEAKQDGRIKTTIVFSEPIKSMGSDWAKINDTTYVYYYYRTKDVTLSFKDLAGNANTKVFSVDRTSPVGTISYSTTELTNGNVIATLETTESIKEIDGWTKESNTVFKKEYAANTDETVNFEDLIGNPGNALISITNIDKVKPEVVSISQLYEAKQDGRIKTTIVFSEPIKSMGSDWAKINDTTYVYYYYRTKDVTLSFKDLAGNANTKMFSVDKTAPSLEVIGINGPAGVMYARLGQNIAIHFTSPEELSNVSVIISGVTASVAKEGNGYRAVASVGNVSKEGKASFIINATDAIGNPATLTIDTFNSTYVTIDKTAPVITIEDYITTPTNQDITVTATTNEGTLNEVSHAFTQNGSFVFTAIDAAGNTTTKTVKISNIDKLEPKIEVKSESVGSINEKVFKNVSFKLSDSYKVKEIILNGKLKELTPNEWSDLNGVNVGDAFGGKYGKNTLVLRDIAGNETTYEFYLDNVGPKIEVKSESVGSINEKVFKNVSFKLSDTYKVKEIVLNGKLKGLTPNEWSDLNGVNVGDAFGGKYGKNTLVLRDIAGNETTYEFYLDNVGPKIEVKSESVGSINETVFKNVSFKLSDTYKVKEIVLNGKLKELTPNEWSDLNGVNVGDAFGGKYGKNTLVLRDIAGNETTYEFYLDNVGPKIEVKSESVGSINEKVFKNVSFKLSDTYKVKEIVLNGKLKGLTPNEWSDLNGVNVGDAFGGKYGKNTLLLRDIAGNETTYEFYLDNLKPELEFVRLNGTGTNVYQKLNGVIYTVLSTNEELRDLPKVTMSGQEAYLVRKTEDGKYQAYFSVLSTTPEGLATFKVEGTDKAGNIAVLETTIIKNTKIIVDKTAPTITMKHGVGETIGMDPYSKVSFSLFDLNKKEVEINGTVRNESSNPYGDLNYVAVGSMNGVSGKNTMILRDKAGNETTYEFYLDNVAPTVETVSGNPTNWTNQNVTLIVNATDNSNLLDSKPYSFDNGATWQIENTKVFTENQPVKIKVKDRAGNISLFTAVSITKIDKELPTIASVTGNPDALTNQDVTLVVTATDNVAVTEYSFDDGATWQTLNTKVFTSNGNVNVKVKDITGNISSVTIVNIENIDKILPNLTINPTNITVAYGDSYDDMAGVSATDNHGTPLVTSDYNSAVLNTVGTYTITYTATDTVGNAATATRTLTVEDKVGPLITLNSGSNILTDFMKVNIGYNQEHFTKKYTASDNYDTNVIVGITTRYETEQEEVPECTKSSWYECLNPSNWENKIYNFIYAIGTTYTSTDTSGNTSLQYYDFEIRRLVNIALAE